MAIRNYGGDEINQKVYIVTDLGPGDGGKGGVINKIANMKRVRAVIKAGGAQGSHGVCKFSGNKFAFSQWGCGTIEGIPTYISSDMIVSPVGLLNEARAIQYELGIHKPFSLLKIDEEALCSTPFHGIASHLKELARRNAPRGTIGTGVGEAYRYSLKHNDLAIHMSDLSLPCLKDRFIAIREQIKQDLAPLFEGEFLPEDSKRVEQEIDLLNDDNYLAYILEIFKEVAQKVEIVNHDYLGREILSKDGNFIVESSHGVLTDCYHGFHPHTSAIRTLPCFRQQMLRNAGYDGEIVNIGVFRSYAVRHGAGPMPTADQKMAENLLPGSHKEENRWQGKIRVGPIDMVALRYAISVCGGPSAFDGLAVTWFDQIVKNGDWRLCREYREGNENRKFFTSSGEIKVRRGTDEEQLKHQENLGKQLMKCKPKISNLEIPQNANNSECYSLCARILEEELGVPVRMVSFGPTERDKICR